MKTVWALFRDTWGGQWSSQNGDETGETIVTWAKQLLRFQQSDILAGANQLIEQWEDKFPPNLPQFQQYIKLHRQRREAEERRTGPGAEAHKRASKEFQQKFFALWKQIQKSPTSREPSDDDVESFEYSYKNLGLDRDPRYGPLT